METLLGRINFDYNNQTASFDVIVGGVAVATYTYAAHYVDLTATTGVVNNQLANVQQNVFLINKFIADVERYMNSADQSGSSFTVELKKTATKLEGTFKLGTVKVSEIEFNPTTLNVAFQPRVAMNIKFVDFVAWRRFIEEFIKLAADF